MIVSVCFDIRDEENARRVREGRNREERSKRNRKEGEKTVKTRKGVEEDRS